MSERVTDASCTITQGISFFDHQNTSHTMGMKGRAAGRMMRHHHMEAMTFMAKICESFQIIIRLGHRINPARMKRMAPGQAFYSQKAPFDGAIFANGLMGIFRTAWVKPACRAQ